MEERVQNLVFMERVTPTRRVIRSDGALYVLLLFFVFGLILLGSYLSVLFDLPRFFVQLALYAVLLGTGYWIYRTQLTSFCYTVTDRMLSVARLTGRKERADAHIHLSDIVSIKPYTGIDPAQAGKLRRLYTGKCQDALAITYAVGAERETLLLSPSNENTGKLIAAWKSSLK